MKKILTILIIIAVLIGAFYTGYSTGIKYFKDNKVTSKGITEIKEPEKPKNATYVIAPWDDNGQTKIADLVAINKSQYGYSNVCKFISIEQGKNAETKRVYVNKFTINPLVDMPKIIINNGEAIIYTADDKLVNTYVGGIK